MLWVLVGLILGALVYAVSIIGEYNVFLKEIQPRIELMERRAEKFEKGADAEGVIIKKVRERLTTSKAEFAQLQQEITAIALKMKTAKAEEEKLEMESYKQDFKRNR